MRVPQAEQPAEPRALVRHQREILVRAELPLGRAVLVGRALGALAHRAGVEALGGAQAEGAVAEEGVALAGVEVAVAELVTAAVGVAGAVVHPGATMFAFI